jgi:hypothetical protein
LLVYNETRRFWYFCGLTHKHPRISDTSTV